MVAVRRAPSGAPVFPCGPVYQPAYGRRLSARVVADDFAGSLKGSQRNTMLAISQMIMLGELAVNRALDNIDPQG